ncbi:hypothetical protein CEXT_713431 [Caerostris extrusa]|uniref:Uncharacterized protein n=1 Tax=Caerostris extrusa TaxID=172846 RepID=A0AAV4MXY9_CAEEX|nr:hypothetical protein CEXT_713431 [Caerostris extrusa]
MTTTTPHHTTVPGAELSLYSLGMIWVIQHSHEGYHLEFSEDLLTVVTSKEAFARRRLLQKEGFGTSRRWQEDFSRTVLPRCFIRLSP